MRTEESFMKELSPERTFLHELATPLAVIRVLTKRQIAELKNPATAQDREKQLERLQKILLALEKIEILHANHKDQISKKAA